VTGKDLDASICRDHLPAWTRWPNWIADGNSPTGLDLAEVLGKPVALNLLFHIPVIWAVLLTALGLYFLLLARHHAQAREATVP